MKLWELCNRTNPTEEEKKEAGKLQAVLSNADVAAVPAGIRGMSK
jgi:4-hydroxy-2-oxoglutarate aldolase